MCSTSSIDVLCQMDIHNVNIPEALALTICDVAQPLPSRFSTNGLTGLASLAHSFELTPDSVDSIWPGDMP